MSDTAAFRSILVPYDGSEPSQTALGLALEAATAGTSLTLLTVVDEAPVIAQSATTVMAYDPTPLFEALDAQAKAVLQDGFDRCKAAGVTAETELIHDSPVAGIVAACAKHDVDLVVMGTHGRKGLARTFVGSTTEGVLRTCDVPVLATRAETTVAAKPFATLLVAVDDSEASDASLALASRLAAALGSRIVAAHVADTTRIYDNAASYGFDPKPLEDDLERDSAAIVTRALATAKLGAESVEVALVEGEPSAAILDAARDRHATAIIMGSHGRRGVRRFMLGSVAEHVVRNATLPVLVVRTHH